MKPEKPGKNNIEKINNKNSEGDGNKNKPEMTSEVQNLDYHTHNEGTLWAFTDNFSDFDNTERIVNDDDRIKILKEGKWTKGKFFPLHTSDLNEARDRMKLLADIEAHLTLRQQDLNLSDQTDRDMIDYPKSNEDFIKLEKDIRKKLDFS